jgi:hypothetical protein
VGPAKASCLTLALLLLEPTAQGWLRPLPTVGRGKHLQVSLPIAP